MKEYIAKTGGRYTYNDDLLNLQELALSMSAIFEGCSNFIVSGCHVSGGAISPGYVWINGKVRHFNGAAEARLPFYIFESNRYETITYAGDVNKHGRCLYQCSGAAALPETADEVTGQLPAYIEIRENYAPRLIDRFMGRYALLLDSPFEKQTVGRDVDFTGSVSVGRELIGKEAIRVVSDSAFHSLCSTVSHEGMASLGLYHQNTLLGELSITSEGVFTFSHQGAARAIIDSNGIRTTNLSCTIGDFGSVRIQSNGIYNNSNATDDGEVRVNRHGYKAGNTRYRNFIVFDGRTANPLFMVEGKTSKVSVSGAFTVSNDHSGMILRNPTWLRSEQALVSLLQWHDKENQRMAYLGYLGGDSLDMTLRNEIGNLTLQPKEWLDLRGEVRLSGKSIADIFVSQPDHAQDLAGKVDKVEGKGLSTEDFTTDYRRKLDAISGGNISTGGQGFVSAEDVAGALAGKLSSSANLSDVSDAARARANIEVYSKTEGDGRYYRIRNYLSEVTTLTAAEVEGKSPEEIIELKMARQQAVLDNIDAERKGTGEGKLAKAQNLGDLTDKARARRNIDVYSIEEINSMLAGKLDGDQAYSGIPFTAELKAKLDGIKTGTFAGTDRDGNHQSQIEGFVSTSSVVRELAKYAPKLLGGYSSADRKEVAENLGLYTRTDADARFGVLSSSFQDYITHLVRQGNTTGQSQKILRDKLQAAAATDLDNYLRRDGKLSDLTLKSDNERKLACQTIGAAYAPEYEKKISDTGWITCGGENAGTLWARQIGNVVCIQGTINTAKRSSNTWGSIATIPNQISPPRFGCRQTVANFNDDHKYNRGCSFVINAGSRVIQMHERGTYNVTTNLSFSYMT